MNVGEGSEFVEELQMKIIIPEKVGRNADYLITNKNYNKVTAGNNLLAAIGATDENPYVMFSTVGTDFYIAAKTKGMFGYKISKQSASSKTIANSRALINQGLDKKRYEIGQMVSQNDIRWFKLVVVKE